MRQPERLGDVLDDHCRRGGGELFLPRLQLR